MPGDGKRRPLTTDGATAPTKKTTSSVPRPGDIPGLSPEVSRLLTEWSRTSQHPARDAADAAGWWNRMKWDDALDEAAASGSTFTANSLQAQYGLPDLGPGVGGVFMKAHHDKRIRRVGYAPATKASSHGSIVAVWVGADALVVDQ